jgi:hypothetical protein
VISLYESVGATDDKNKPYGYGDFAAAYPDAKDMCPVNNVAAGAAEYAEIEDTMGAGIDPATDCTKDEDCQIPADPMDPMSMPDPASGSICDTTTMKCTVGCRGAGPNSCVSPFGCTSADDTAGKCLLPAKSVKYEWTNLEIYVTAAAQGTQFQGDLKYTEDGCSIDYHVVGMWPGIDCTVYDMDGNPTDQGDEDACNPCAEPDKGRVAGSGISPEFPTKCQPLADGLHYCVLPGQDVPQLQTATECPGAGF